MTASSTSLDRRRLLQLAAGGAAAVAVPAVSARRASAALRVGVLVPTADAHLPAGNSFLAGVRLHLEQARPELRTSVAAEPVPHGYRRAQHAAERLLDRHRSDVVLAGITAPAARHLTPLFEAHRSPLLLANLGAHVVPAAATSPWVLHHGLDYWESSFAFGAWAADRLGPRAVVVAPVAATGYDTILAFRRGLESRGGEVAAVLTSHPAAGDPQLDALLDDAAAHRPDFVYGLYSGGRAAEFLHAYRAHRSLARTPLAGGGLMVEDSLVPRLAPQALGIANALPWARSLPTPANDAFARAYRARTGRAPDVFALLGYEAALLATIGVGADGSKAGLLDALAGRRIEAPRGTLAVASDARTVDGPLYIRDVRRSGAGGLANVVVETAGPVHRAHGGLRELHTPYASGYVNELLFDA